MHTFFQSGKILAQAGSRCRNKHGVCVSLKAADALPLGPLVQSVRTGDSEDKLPIFKFQSSERIFSFQALPVQLFFIYDRKQ